MEEQQMETFNWILKLSVILMDLREWTMFTRNDAEKKRGCPAGLLPC